MACINIFFRVAKYLYLHILLSKPSALSNMRQQLCSEVCCGPVPARRDLSEMHYLRWESILPKKGMCHGRHFNVQLLGLTSHHLSSPGLVCGHVLEAYQWLPEHPVTLQSRLSLVEGHSHVAQGREEEWTGVEACRPLSFCS